MNIRLRRVLSRIGLVFLAVIVIILGIRAVFNYTTGKKLQAYLEDAKAKGIPTSLKEIAPRCDDPDNAARLWKAAEALLVIPEGDDKGLTSKALLSRTIEDFFYARPVKEETRKQLTGLIALNRRSLDLVLEAAARPCFRYVDWSKKFYAIDPLNAIKSISATRLLGIDSVLKAEAGQTQRALDQLRLGMSFTLRTLDEPFLLNGLVALANMKSLFVCFDRVVAGREIDSQILAAWIKEMDPDPWRAKFWRCTEAERLLALEAGLDLIRGQKEALGVPGSEDNMFWYWLIRPLEKSQVIWVQNQYLNLEKHSGLPYYETTQRAKDGRLKWESLPWYHRLTGLLLTHFDSVFLKEATLEAMMLTTKAGLACKIYKKQRDHYPEKLEALVPEFLDELPIDPFTGKPLIFRLQVDGGIIIYSVGSNEKDDGGRGTYMITQLTMEKDDDWAWSEK